MVVDTSAIYAILFLEPEASDLLRKLREAGRGFIAAPVVVELGIQLDKLKNHDRRAILTRNFDRLGLEVVAVDAELAIVARDAHTAYGRYSKHPARLNFGDCFSYALAKSRDEPLLFKGQDFGHTDITPA